ncbi:MAG: hypothetical protein RR007_00105 [Kiritimatiellia bacterium]
MRLFHVLSIALLLATAVSGVTVEEEKLAADITKALSIQFQPSAELKLHDTFVRLSSETATITDLEFLRTYEATSAKKDPRLTPFLTAIELLRLALSNHLEEYKTGLLQFRKTCHVATFTQLADVSDALIVCPTCNGNLSCSLCRGSLKCALCKGRGRILRKTAGNSLAKGGRTACEACNGTGKCPECKGLRKTCNACHNSGKTPNTIELHARIMTLAKNAAAHTATTLKSEIDARTQTAALAEQLRALQALRDPTEALTLLQNLPKEITTAAMWSEIALVRADLETIQKQQSDNSAEKVAARETLRSAIRDAQRNTDPLAGLLALIKSMQTSADCDVLPEAQTAFDGILSAAQLKLNVLVEGCETQVSAIKSLTDSTVRLAQIEQVLANWPEWSLPKGLISYRKDHDTPELKKLCNDTRLSDLREQLVTLQSATSVQVQEQETQKPNWWVWALIGTGAFVAIYFFGSLFSNLAARKAEAAKKARQQAALDSIRKTFSHRRDH